MESFALPAPLMLDEKTLQTLLQLASAQDTPDAKRVRAQVLLAFAGGVRISAIADQFQVHRTRAVRIIRQAQDMGILASLQERRGRNSRPKIPMASIQWLLAVADCPPSHHGYSRRTWTAADLLDFGRTQGPRLGHPALAELSQNQVYRYFSRFGRPFARRGAQGKDTRKANPVEPGRTQAAG